MRRGTVVATPLILLFSCASPTLKEQQLTNVKGVKDILKAEKAEYMDLSPTETFALGDFRATQLNLNKWCIQRGGTPLYCYKDLFGEEVCQKLIYDGNKPQYVTDIYESPDKYVVCKLPNGKQLYKYKAYIVGRGYRYTAGRVYIGFLIDHKPTEMEFFSTDFEVPNSLDKFPHIIINDPPYYRMYWFINKEFNGFYGLGNFLRTYLYCRYKLGGKYYKGNIPFEKWFKSEVVEKGVASYVDNPQYAKEFTGLYYCYAGNQSFKVKVGYLKYQDGNAEYVATYKVEPLKNLPVGEEISNATTQTNITQSEIKPPTALSPLKDIAVYVAKTQQPFKAIAGGVLVLATPVEVNQDCTSVLVSKYVNGILTQKESFKVCNGQVIGQGDVSPVKQPTPTVTNTTLGKLIPQCQSYGKASLNFAGYEIKCQALDSNHCNLQISTLKNGEVLDVKTINVCN